MDRLRSVVGKLSSNRKNQDLEIPEPARPRHAVDTLPSLPSPRRPITSVTLNPQLGSTFFKLPAEIRQEIYRLVISNRVIHMDMRYTSVETTTPHSTKGAVFATQRRWRWRASTCHREPGAPVSNDTCGWGGPPPTACDKHDTPCGVGAEVLGLLLCCRLGYREAVEVLYGENTFHISTGALLLYTDRLLPVERSSSITSLIYYLTPESMWYYARTHLGLEPGNAAISALLSRIPIAFPSLKRLQVVLPSGMSMAVLLEGERIRGIPVAPHDNDCLRPHILSHIDNLVGAFRHTLEECSVIVMIDEETFDYVAAGDDQIAETVESPTGARAQYWRRIPDADRDGAVNTGYWVRNEKVWLRFGSTTVV
jgi:hypothetical protein